MKPKQLELFAQQNPHAFEKLVFSTTCRYYELEAIRKAKPRHVLLSYAHWKNKELQTDFIDRVGYRPDTIIIDSGAYTFAAAGEDTGIYDSMEWQDDTDEEPEMIALRMAHDLYACDNYCPFTGEPNEYSPIYKYEQWLQSNMGSYDYCIQMDEMRDGDASLFAYRVMKEMNAKAIPVFHYGSSLELLQQLIAEGGADYIALGASAMLNPNQRAKWARPIIEAFPQVKFHLLGTMNKRLIEKLPGLYSADGTAWIKAGRNRHVCNGEDRLAATIDEIKKRA